MTWYAQQVFAEPHPLVIDAFRGLPGFGKALYYIPHLKDFQCEDQIVDGMIMEGDEMVPLLRTIQRGPQLPANGLLIARELCASDADSDSTEWFGEDAIAWDSLVDQTLAPADSLLDMSKVFLDAPDWWANQAPPPSVLSRFKQIAETTKTAVGYFSCNMWGGDVESAFGWIWDGRRGTSCFYRAVTTPDEEGKEATGFYTDMAGAFAIDDLERRFIVNGDVLTLMLLHFGVLLRDGYFELHTGSFPWERYRLE